MGPRLNTIPYVLQFASSFLHYSLSADSEATVYYGVSKVFRLPHTCVRILLPPE